MSHDFHYLYYLNGAIENRFFCSTNLTIYSIYFAKPEYKPSLDMDLLSTEYGSSSEDEFTKISTKRTNHESADSQIVKRSKIDLAPDVSLEVGG